MKQLNNAVEFLNLETGNPTVTWASRDGKMRGQVGNFYVDQSYGGFQLVQVTNEGGGVRNIQPVRGTKTDCWNAVHTALNILRK
jgi:hypothetical protein